MPSSSSVSGDSALRQRAAPADLTIVDWPLRDQPLSSALPMTLVAGSAWLAVWATGSAFAGAVIAILLAATIWRTWLPTRYELGSSGLVQCVLRRRRRISWAAIGAFDFRADGVLLRIDKVSTPGAPSDAIYLRWGPHAETVKAHIDYYVVQREKISGGSTRVRGQADRGSNAGT